MSKVVYIGAFLSPMERTRLLADSRPHPHLTRIYGEHVTLCYRPTEDELFEWLPLLGREIKIEVLSGRSDARGYARLVRLPEDVMCKNGVPHVTIGCAEGTAPVYSNQLLAGAIDDRPRREPHTLVVHATIDAYPRTHPRT